MSDTVTFAVYNDPTAAARYCARQGCDRPSTHVTYPGTRFTCADHILTVTVTDRTEGAW